MESSVLPIVDIYPIVEPDFGGSVLSPEVLNSADEYADFIAYCRTHGAIQTEVSEKLSSLYAYKQCKRKMLRLKDVPNINKYRNHPENYCQESVQKELLKNGQYLSPGQQLFHGGTFPLLNDNGEPVLNREFTLTKPLSTSFCAMIAGAHSDTHLTKHLWVISVSEHCKVPVYVFSNAQNQVQGRELEVLLGTGARIKCTNVRHNDHYDILQIVVT
ncbi:hypothetical protein [Grimontia sp. NTOU-MAR1]|uniref:hypothetical protein n=1 Tax=Grimontia sp. NTOU-MAR1 TaxID=3111011 RepID=UPI002DB94551|nr:hypothetical protein [Grimontia sp. NTOU-MAR1]WRV98532.1 hypothetical protein VP504_03590 [Grimontia sp. NTOU-MAR1]